MVLLVSSKGVQAVTRRKEATRSGSELVPAVVRNAGPQAVESYLCFFAGESRTSVPVYRTAAQHFFRWCEEAAVTLEAICPGHIDAYLKAKQEVWKPATLLSAFQSLKKLFAHLDADRIIERTPFIGMKAPKSPKPQRKPVTPEELKAVAHDLDEGEEEDSAAFRATLVALYPIVIGGMDPAKIAAFTGIAFPEVEGYVRNLRKNGIWTPEGKIAAESYPDVEALEIILQVLCALDMVERRNEDQPRYYPAAGRPKP